ncbi:MAG: hypothetical protein ABSH48_13465 [Verrucomicrobiota bacterium]
MEHSLLDAGVKPSIACDLRCVQLYEPARLALLGENPVSWHTALDMVWTIIGEKINLILSNPQFGESLDNQGRFRSLCRVQREWGLDPDTFRRLLIREGLEGSRASEIKVIVACDQICRRFTATADPLTWKEAKSLARQARDQEEGASDYPAKQAARRVIRLVVRHPWPEPADRQTGSPALTGKREPNGTFVVTLANLGTVTLVPKSIIPSTKNSNNHGQQ